MKIQTIVLSVLLLCLILGSLMAQEAIEITFEDGYTTDAELIMPEEDNPTVIMFHGSGPYDMDSTYTLPTGQQLSANFALLAERLNEEGIGSLRYNKRGALGGGQFDMEQVQRSTLDVLISDAQAVLDFALEQDGIGDIYLYGWSEGTWVASHLAANNLDDIAGVILQAPPNQALAGVLDYQYFELGIPYLSESVDADGDGAIVMDELFGIQGGATSFIPWFSQDSSFTNPELNPVLDANGDGSIHIDDELVPGLEQTIEMLKEFDDGINRVNSDLLAETDIPVLILHGDADGWVPLSEGEAIAELLGEQATLYTYEGLGHALDETPDPQVDTFGIMADQPIDDLIEWIK